MKRHRTLLFGVQIAGSNSN